MAEKADMGLLKSAWQNAASRVIFLDYDGTLVPFHDHPSDSLLDTGTRRIIKRLATDPANTLFIISGRDRDFLESQFGDMEAAGLIAEHGFLIRPPSGEWQQQIHVEDAWKQTIRELFRNYVENNPGCFIEEKESAIVFHYRTARNKAGGRVRPQISHEFEQIRRRFPALELLNGDHVIEIKPGNFNKGNAALAVLEDSRPDLILAAGDDLTDEQLFKQLPSYSFTLKIGQPPTVARYYTESQKEFLCILGEL